MLKKAMSSALSTFQAGAGCYWGVEHYYKKQFPEIKNVQVGFAGGSVDAPTYTAVCGGQTGHAEVVNFEYDPTAVEFEALVRFFFQMHDPTTLNAQGNDRGTQYRSVLYFTDDNEKAVIEKVIAEVSKNAEFLAAFKGREIVTELVPMAQFYPAQEEHQAYLDKNPGGYCNHGIKWTPKDE